MVTPGKRLCTSGREAQLKSGTFARGGSTSSPLWAWGTPRRSSGPSQVKNHNSLASRFCHFFFNLLIKPKRKPCWGSWNISPGQVSHTHNSAGLVPQSIPGHYVTLLCLYWSGNGCFFGCTSVLISLEYTVGWKATVSKVITSDMWQQGYYSCYSMCIRVCPVA